MRQRALVIVLAIAVLGGCVYWWKRSRSSSDSDSPATPAATAGSGSGSSASPTRTAKVAAKDAAPASLVVTVTDEKKQPIANASVRIAPDDGEVILLRTEADGTARAPKLEPGDHAVSASAADHLPTGVRDHKLIAGQASELTLVLRTGGRLLSGTVTDVNGGAIAGARIDAALLDGAIRPNAAVASTLTGADGKYAMSVAEGHVFVAARSADYAPQTRHVEVGPSGATANFALIPGGVIEGVVRDDRTKQPVPNAVVSARRDAGAMLLAEGGRREVTAGPDGKFRLAGLRPGAYDLDATEGEKHTRSPTVVGLGVAEQVGDVELLIGIGPVVRGKVLDDKDAPVAGVTIFVMSGEGSSGSTSAKSDDRGAFVLTGLPPGKFGLHGTSETHVMAGEPARVEVLDKDVDDVVVRVQPGIRIKGHVEPRQVAEIRLEPERFEGMAMMMLMAPATSDANGEFTIGPLLPTKGKLFARSSESGERGELGVDVRAGMPEVVIKLTPGGSIAGRVIDGDGKPVGGVAVAANETGGTAERTMIVNGRITSGVQAMTNASGAFELKGLAAGAYKVAALEKGRPMRTRGKVPTVTLTAAEKKTGVELAVDRQNGTIKGVVTDAAGAPLADAWVSVHQDVHGMIEGLRGSGPGPGGGGPAGPPGPPGPNEDGPGERSMMVLATSDDGPGGALASDFPPTLTDAQGRFAITGLPHTSFEVVAEAKSSKLRGRAEKVTPDATVTIKALGVTTLKGTVVGPKGKPALFSVELDGPTRAQRSFTDGEFSLARVDPGRYHVTVTSSDGNGEADVVVEPDKTTTVEIKLIANSYITGTLVDGGGKPVAGLGVAIIEDQPEGRLSIRLEGPPPRSGPDGKFKIEHKAGKCALVVLNPGAPPVVKRGLSLDAGQTLDVGQIRVEGPPGGGSGSGGPPK